MSPMHHRRLALLGVLCLTLAACAGPVRAVRVDRTVAYRDLTRSVVATGELSWATRNVLLERDLYATFGTRPEVAIAELHRAMVDAAGDGLNQVSVDLARNLDAARSPYHADGGRQHVAATSVHPGPAGHSGGTVDQGAFDHLGRGDRRGRPR